MADGTTKPIQDVKAGDEIQNAQPGGHDEKHRVDAVHKTLTDKDFTDLTISTPAGPKTITGTQNHPYYDLTTARFTNASQLKAGDRLQTDIGAEVTVLAVHNYTSSMVTYDLTIHGLHTYYVVAGDTPVLVHNSNCESIALGKQTVGDNGSALDEFGLDVGAKTYKQWPGKGQWCDKLKGYLSDGTTQIHVNLDGIENPVEYAKSGAGVDPASDWEGYTRWEMYQLSQSSGAWDRVTWYRGGTPVSNPFGGSDGRRGPVLVKRLVFPSMALWRGAFSTIDTDVRRRYR